LVGSIGGQEFPAAWILIQPKQSGLFSVSRSATKIRDNNAASGSTKGVGSNFLQVFRELTFFRAAPE